MATIRGRRVLGCRASERFYNDSPWYTALLRAKLRRITLSSLALGLALGIVHRCATGAASIEHTSSIRNHQHAQCAQ